MSREALDFPGVQNLIGYHFWIFDNQASVRLPFLNLQLPGKPGQVGQNGNLILLPAVLIGSLSCFGGMCFYFLPTQKLALCSWITRCCALSLKLHFQCGYWKYFASWMFSWYELSHFCQMNSFYYPFLDSLQEIELYKSQSPKQS